MLRDVARSLGLTGKEPKLSTADLGQDFLSLRSHVIKRIEDTEVGQKPFYFSYIESIFPEDYYERLRAHMLSLKGTDKMQPRAQDNAKFVNRRYNLVESGDQLILQLRAIFQDEVVKKALFSKFYLFPENMDHENVVIHKEFEYVFCEADRFQNMHIDIPPKIMSFVFYIPESKVSEDQEKKNATILYDKNLKPQYGARFRKNSVCIFVPHFYSYHGFSSTMERDVLVMFYVNRKIMNNWKKNTKNESPPFTELLDIAEEKIRAYPLIEYGDDLDRIKAERNECRINAPNGRVMVD